MEVFRISREKYSKAFSASGVAARWNKDNQFVLYTGQARSLSTLEMVVHKNIETALNYEVMVISIAADEKLFTRFYIKDLPLNWREASSYSVLQDIGSDWYTNNKSLVLQVPSVIVPQEFNYIINTRHPDLSPKTVSLARTEEFTWDDRLLI
jgi:RES domain-containing protein